MKKTAFAIILNILFGGVGYLYLKEPTRKPLAIFLILVTIYELVRNIYVISSPATANNPLAIHTLPMLSLLGTIPGAILLTIMAIDVYLLAKKRSGPTIQIGAATK